MSNVGKVVQIIGPVVDVEFGEDHLPAIYNAVRIVDSGEGTGVPVDAGSPGNFLLHVPEGVGPGAS